MLEGLEPVARIAPCAVRDTLDKLDEADKKILLEAVADTDTWTANGLMTALKRRGVTMGDKAIRKHREGVCSCSKT